MPIYDIDGDGDAQPLGDCLLILKYFLGFRGADLISGGINPAGSRNTAELCEAYLELIWWQVDVGGDGVVGYVDCLLIILYAIGLRGSNLVRFANTAGSIRVKAPDVEAYIAKMLT